MSGTETIDTRIGEAHVLHRLALVVECLDAITGGRVRADVNVDREIDPLLLPRQRRDLAPLAPLVTRGTGRGLVLFDHATPATTPVRLRLWDRHRRYAPRRMEVPLWSLADIVAAEGAPPAVPATSRMLRPHLFPGAAGPVPRGATTIRGRVASGGAPVRWARVRAVRTGDVRIGHAHADEHGEFLLVLLGTGTLPPPAPSRLSVDLEVTAPDPATAPAPDPHDPLADLVVEPVTRSSNPPLPAEIDNDVLRGIAPPPGHVVNSAPVPSLMVPTGADLTLTEPIPFAA